jgi:hypothetical protein
MTASGEGGSARLEHGGPRSSLACVVEYGRRVLGVALLLLVVLPIYGALADASGLGAQQTLRLAGRYTRFLWTGLGGTLFVALVLAGLLSPSFITEKLERLKERLMAIKRTTFIWALAILAGGLTLAFSLLVLDGRPVMLDAVSQLLQGRYFAAGELAGPVLEFPEFWQFQFMLDTPNGWVSQYPFGHALLLALGFSLGAVWLVGPLLVAITVALTALIAERLFPEDPLTARLGAVLLAVSPFFVALAGSYMNHVTAAAFAALAAYCALRARDGRAEWALAAGAALGAVFVTRPLAGVVIGAVVALGIWLAGWSEGRLRGGALGARAALAVAGGLPFAAGLAVYNGHFFGSPLRFGYLAAWGPRHGLGFHLDPWGNAYGPIEALAYTSADLLGLSTELLWSTVPVVAVVGLYLTLGKRLAGGIRLLIAWALLPALANAFYWHHDLLMGPRMLNEAAPAWALLAAAAAVGLVRLTPARLPIAGGRFSPRVAVTLALLMGLAAGIFYYGPRRLWSFGRVQEYAGSSLEAPRTAFPSLVFVHDSWRTRLGVRLHAGGMRLDSIQAALSHTEPCTVQGFLEMGEAGASGGGETLRLELRFEAASGTEPEDTSQAGALSPAEEGLAFECRRQFTSDGRGVTGLPALLWQGDLPGLSPGGAMFVRDMGPERNALLIDRFPGRRPLFLMPASPLARLREPRLVSFERGTSLLWRTEPEAGGERGPGAGVVEQNA